MEGHSEEGMFRQRPEDEEDEPSKKPTEGALDQTEGIASTRHQAGKELRIFSDQISLMVHTNKTITQKVFKKQTTENNWEI